MAEKLLVNPIDCEGHGACAELLPEAITLDEWGYPLVDPRPLPPGLERNARAAVSACPTLALRLVRSETTRRKIKNLRTARPERVRASPPREARTRSECWP